ncbi:Acetyltransferase (GNAT) domain-containing protein [Rhizobium mongolense subsp. loessense]|uniref:Acetyltransferase (GNAT) domain-containing protein n=1 Tax=Rhizobium mongolense subsp. loessense TaxID=158890 RepID=A0A1G4TF50_9HYPH|nr:GNAT family N-acetyltransferase [Rhizobium mongolense]SCW79994.1 Acetyltransferase (GNAT) domain-containing protein [Rhizobium mongolense subsp. loessense]
MKTTEIDLAPFGTEHLKGAVALSRQAGWPHRPEDWAMVLSLSSGVVALEDKDRVVGTVLVTPYGDNCATINMVIVDEAMRGRGLGRKLMDCALTIAGNRPLRLVATSDGLPLYEKLGFRQTGSVLQYQGSVPAIDHPDGVLPANQDDLAAIVALDRAAFGAERRSLLEYIAKIGRFAVIRQAGEVRGFAALRTFGRGEVIGPVAAAHAGDACALISFFIASRPGAFLRIDTTADAGLAPWLAERGFAHAGGGIVMGKGSIEPTTSPALKTFALANQALG